MTKSYYHYYLITNLLTGTKYVGKKKHSKIEESEKYWSSSNFVKDDILKYGVGNFSKELLGESFNITSRESSEIESSLILAWASEHNMYNKVAWPVYHLFLSEEDLVKNGRNRMKNYQNWPIEKKILRGTKISRTHRNKSIEEKKLISSKISFLTKKGFESMSQEQKEKAKQTRIKRHQELRTPCIIDNVRYKRLLDASKTLKIRQIFLRNLCNDPNIETHIWDV